MTKRQTLAIGLILAASTIAVQFLIGSSIPGAAQIMVQDLAQMGGRLDACAFGALLDPFYCS